MTPYRVLEFAMIDSFSLKGSNLEVYNTQTTYYKSDSLKNLLTAFFLLRDKLIELFIYIRQQPSNENFNLLGNL